MLYALLCYHSEDVVCRWSQHENDDVMAKLGAVTAKLAKAGKLGPVATFSLINSQREFNRWSPFLDADPTVKLDFKGRESGVGAFNAWAGNSKVGKGAVEIIESAASSRVAMKLEMVKPMKASNRVEFTLTPRAGGTNVIWTMSGAQPFLGKLMSLVIDCESMCGGQFEKGLANLKRLAERRLSVAAE